MNEIPQNIAQTILNQSAYEAESRIETEAAHDGTPIEVLVARQGVTATILQSQLDAFAAVPRSRAGRVQALDLASFAALVLRDYDPGSVIFADVSGPGVIFEAVLDYHHIANGQCSEGRQGQRHGRETVIYTPKLSPEWKAWIEQSGQPMTQGKFAEWIDEHLPDLADPRHLRDEGMGDTAAAKYGAIYGGTKETLYGYADPERMIKLSEGMAVRESSAVKSVVNLQSGESQFQYETSHTDAAGQPLNVPRRFLLSVPVFDREAAYLVPVKLSYRKKGGSIEWTFDLVRPDKFRDDAIEGMRAELAKLLTPPLPAGDDAPKTSAPVVPIHLAARVKS